MSAYPTLIALSGYSRVGKDTAAVPLVADGWERKSFAEPLRGMCRDSGARLPDGRLWAQVCDELGYEAAKDAVPGFRDVLVDMGQAARRHLGADVWVRPVVRCVGPGRRIVVTDCRFPNEADAIRDRGGLVVRINKPGVGPALRPDGTPQVSDVALDDYDFDHVIVNDGSVERLQTLLRAIAAISAAA